MNLFHKPTGKCCKCGTRDATVWWTNGGIYAAVHGFGEPRCELCCVEAQLEEARKLTAKIPELEAKVKLLRAMAGMESGLKQIKAALDDPGD